MTISEASGAIQVHVAKVTQNVKRQIVSRGMRAANELRNAEQDTLNGAGHGRVYYKPHGGKYTASAPGEVPARRLGDLRRDWEPKTQSSNNGVTAYIESAMPYADYLEHGTKKMAARPYVEKIKTRALPKIVKIYSETYIM